MAKELEEMGGSASSPQLSISQVTVKLTNIAYFVLSGCTTNFILIGSFDRMSKSSSDYLLIHDSLRQQTDC